MIEAIDTPRISTRTKAILIPIRKPATAKEKIRVKTLLKAFQRDYQACLRVVFEAKSIKLIPTPPSREKMDFHRIKGILSLLGVSQEFGFAGDADLT